MNTEKMSAEKTQTFSDSAFDPYDLLGQGVKNGKNHFSGTGTEQTGTNNVIPAERDDFL